MFISNWNNGRQERLHQAFGLAINIKTETNLSNRKNLKHLLFFKNMFDVAFSQHFDWNVYKCVCKDDTTDGTFQEHWTHRGLCMGRAVDMVDYCSLNLVKIYQVTIDDMRTGSPYA